MKNAKIILEPVKWINGDLTDNKCKVVNWTKFKPENKEQIKAYSWFQVH